GHGAHDAPKHRNPELRVEWLKLQSRTGQKQRTSRLMESRSPDNSDQLSRSSTFQSRPWRMSTKCPATAAAAAIMGLTKCVRPPLPWRPSKFRLDVLAQRSPAGRTSAFMPIHMLQPESRHSKPASRKILSKPSCSA